MTGIQGETHSRCPFRHAWSVLCLLALFTAPALAQTAESPVEYQLKAAFLLNFTKFVEWPPAAFEDAKSPLAICLLGDDPFGAALDQLVAGEVVNDHKLVVKRIRKIPAPHSCQALFVAASEPDVSAAIAALGPGVLTVGEGERFLREGGMIAFVVSGKHIRFDISQVAASKASLTISARLLNVARSVQK